jgi:Domain of unknown function (DUF4282)
MAGYFSFDRMITTAFVKAIYLFGFLVLTAGGIALTVWAGLQLHDARIARSLGWRYVAVGAAAIIIGNLVWRVLCELWIVLFGIHSQIVSINNTVHFRGLEPQTRTETLVSEKEPEEETTRDVITPSKRNSGQASVLGLS